MRLARELGPGHTIVTILCDGGTRYQSKLFNPQFLIAKDLPRPEWLDSIELSDTVKQALERARVKEDSAAASSSAPPPS